MYLHKYAKGHKLELVYLWSYTVSMCRDTAVDSQTNHVRVEIL